ncbi:ATP-binding protein [Lacrimispora xylanisolvens]|uniref:ATP-binding protein n=1 Tax=Lacrimispora xylanisolvens TaxID=384636 RepID=UPI002402C00D
MVDKSRSRSRHGAGLGLTLCAEIARLHGTDLTIGSVVGMGTTVSFNLEVSNNE